MSWLEKLLPPKITPTDPTERRSVPEGLWVKCPSCEAVLYKTDLEKNQNVCPQCSHHHRMDARARLDAFLDPEGRYELGQEVLPVDPLKFRDEKRYVDRLKDAKAKSGEEDSVQAGYGQVNDQAMVIAVQDMGFIGGSLGMAAGDAIIAAMRYAVTKNCPFVMFVASGGARMQEGILSLMQLPRTTIAVQELRAAKLPYIVVLTNPTTGGVTASYAMLGDVHLAEPNAIIGFAGQRVIEQTIREKLPEGFQRSEYLKDHGMVDSVVHRHEMKTTISRLARMLTKITVYEAPVGALVPV